MKPLPHEHSSWYAQVHTLCALSYVCWYVCGTHLMCCTIWSTKGPLPVCTLHGFHCYWMYSASHIWMCMLLSCEYLRIYDAGHTCIRPFGNTPRYIQALIYTFRYIYGCKYWRCELHNVYVYVCIYKHKCTCTYLLANTSIWIRASLIQRSIHAWMHEWGNTFLLTQWCLLCTYKNIHRERG